MPFFDQRVRVERSGHDRLRSSIGSILHPYPARYHNLAVYMQLTRKPRFYEALCVRGRVRLEANIRDFILAPAAISHTK